MPIYEYECQTCRHRFERRQSFRDEPVKVCPECGGTTRRLLQAPPIIFKGSGWYATDSRTSPASAAEPSSTGGSPDSGSGASSPAPKKSGREKPASGAEKKE
jgi:putative FmdB family regulatory protein